MKIIHIGVLGCANVAERSVIPAIKNLPNNFKLIAIASRDYKKAQSFAQKFNCEPIEGYGDLINRKDIDAIYIPLPTGLHAEWVNKALFAGKHVYAEKSIASTFSETKEMVHNAKMSNLALMEGYMFQYHSQHQSVMKLINEGVIGETRYFSASFGFPPLLPENFRYDKIIGGGALMDAAGYPLRAAFFILGNELKVTGASVHYDPKSGTSIYGSAYLSGKNGVGASISFGFDNYYQCSYQLWGSKGRMSVEKAYTPGPDFIPTFLIENMDGKRTIKSTPDNHFQKAFLEFHRIIVGEGKGNHYNDILIQSKSLEEIKIQSQMI
ncbi:MAG: Gfo/Idh/MocA family oxidoreductase [Elusimicrobiota bacterium]